MKSPNDRQFGLDPRIKPQELERLFSQGLPVQLIDVRSPAEYAEAHVPGAINIPLEELPSRLTDIRADRPTVLVCQSGRRAEMCREVVESALPSPSVLVGGTSAWSKEGRPVVGTRPAGLPLMRQVQLAAGTLALGGAVLAQFVHPGWIWLSGFVGGGLVLAGTTGFCGLANLLALLPWNRTGRSRRAIPSCPQS
ncbi:MAG: rhodanese-like domain-containing protein [Fimbriimonas sp.]